MDADFSFPFFASRAFFEGAFPDFGVAEEEEEDVADSATELDVDVTDFLSSASAPEVDAVGAAAPFPAAADVVFLALGVPSLFFFLEADDVVGVDLRGGRDLAVVVVVVDALEDDAGFEADKGLERDPRFLTASGLRRASSLWDRLKLSVAENLGMKILIEYD